MKKSLGDGVNLPHPNWNRVKIIRHFRREIYNGITLNDVFEEQTNLKDEIDKFKDFTMPKIQNKNDNKVLAFENINKPLERRQKVLNAFKSKIFPKRRTTQGKSLKILTLKQMLQRLHIELIDYI